MQGFGVGALIAGYCAWYTLYQKTWGDGSGFLYNLTGSSRFGGPIKQAASNSPTSPNLPTGQVYPTGQKPGTVGVPFGK